MKVLKMVLAMILIYGTLLSVRVADWVVNVGGPYMGMSYERSRCNRFEAARSLDDMEKQNGFEQTVGICPFDEQGCDNAEKMTTEYELSHAHYLDRWRWMPLVIKPEFEE